MMQVVRTPLENFLLAIYWLLECILPSPHLVLLGREPSSSGNDGGLSEP